MVTVLIFTVGVVAGCILTKILRNIKSIGTLRVDSSDEDGPYMFLELDKDVGVVASKKYVLLRVNLKKYISRK